MTYVITAACCKATACVDVCPVDCIHGKDEDGPQQYIDPNTCIDCGYCVAACPNGAIYPDVEVPDKWRAAVAVNYEHFGLDAPF